MGRIAPQDREIIVAWGRESRWDRADLLYWRGDDAHRAVARTLSYALEGPWYVPNWLRGYKELPSLMDQLVAAGYDRKSTRMRVRRLDFEGKPCRKFRKPKDGMMAWFEDGNLAVIGGSDADQRLLREGLTADRVSPGFLTAAERDPGLAEYLTEAAYDLGSFCFSINLRTKDRA